MEQKKKNVCILKYIDVFQADGGQRVAVNLANALCDKYEIYFLALINDGDELAFELQSNVKCIKINMHGKRMRNILPSLILEVRKIFKKYNITEVLSIGASMNVVMLAAAFGRGIKTIYCEHSNLIQMECGDSSQQLNQKIGARYADYVITLTQSNTEEVKRRFPKRKGRVQHIYNWVEDDSVKECIPYRVESKRIITVARHTPLKGLDDIMEIGKELFLKYPDWHWDIYGGGEEKYVKATEKMIKDYHLENNVHLMGQVDYLYERYQEYSFFVFTSKREGLPMVLLEAKGSGLPVLSYDCTTGPSEIVRDQIDGYLIPVNDKSAMYQSICEMIENPNKRCYFSENARGNLRDFDKNRILNEWIKLIES